MQCSRNTLDCHSAQVSKCFCKVSSGCKAKLQLIYRNAAWTSACERFGHMARHIRENSCQYSDIHEFINLKQGTLNLDPLGISVPNCAISSDTGPNKSATVSSEGSGVAVPIRLWVWSFRTASTPCSLTKSSRRNFRKSNLNLLEAVMEVQLWNSEQLVPLNNIPGCSRSVSSCTPDMAAQDLTSGADS